ncbi:hypothetical protein ACFLXG_02825 [Chloroflexota bacterium]
MGKTVMIFGLGNLGGWVLEFLSRCDGVSTIITADLREDWGARKTDTAAIGATQQGYSKTIKFYKCDLRDMDGTVELLRAINPDLIYADVSLSSWLVQSDLVSKMSCFLPDITKKWTRVVGARSPLQVVLVSKLMQAVKKSGINALVLNNSYPDIVNPVLWRNGLGPLVGAGNMDLVVGEIKRKISVAENVPIREITICMIGAHALYTMDTRTGVPYFLKILVRDRDITSKVDVDSLISERLTACPASELSWIGQPQVAASAVKNIMAILNDTNEYTHAPGPIGLPGGYPVRLNAKGVEVILPEEITLEEAIKINLCDLKYEGVEELKDDGTIVITEEAYKIHKELLGVDRKEIRFADMEDVSEELLSGYKKLEKRHTCSS